MRDVIDVCDACVGRITGGFPEGVPPATVCRSYAFDVPDSARGMSSVDGRQVWVFPAQYGQAGVMDRGTDQGEVRVFVLVVEVYPGDERPVPNEWLDERVRWAQAMIFDRLGDAREGWLFGGGMYPESNECEAVYDLAELRESAAFWSEFVFTYRG